MVGKACLPGIHSKAQACYDMVSGVERSMGGAGYFVPVAVQSLLGAVPNC